MNPNQDAWRNGEGRILVSDPTPRGWRLDVVKQLLGDLDTATIAGCHFTMDRVIGVLRQEIGVADAGLNELQRRALKRAIDDLGREQGRLLPDAGTFVARARMITDTLALI